MFALHRVQLVGGKGYFVPINQRRVVGAEPNCVIDAGSFFGVIDAT